MDRWKHQEMGKWGAGGPRSAGNEAKRMSGDQWIIEDQIGAKDISSWFSSTSAIILQAPEHTPTYIAGNHYWQSIIYIRPTMPKQSPAPRPKYNNFNPYNNLGLNKYHQIGAKAPASESKLLHKRKRDLERLIKHKQDKQEPVDQTKLDQLQRVEQELAEGRKDFEKKMRKEFFIKGKYKQIMEIEMRKVNKKIRALRDAKDEHSRAELAEWEKKQRYIKFFPKNLRYVSLFPSSKPLEQKAIEFQQRIMDDIEATYRAKVQKRNEYQSENAKPAESKKKKADNFFIEEESAGGEGKSDEEEA